MGPIDRVRDTIAGVANTTVSFHISSQKISRPEDKAMSRSNQGKLFNSV